MGNNRAALVLDYLDGSRESQQSAPRALSFDMHIFDHHDSFLHVGVVWRFQLVFRC